MTIDYPFLRAFIVPSALLLYDWCFWVVVVGFIFGFFCGNQYSGAILGGVLFNPLVLTMFIVYWGFGSCVFHVVFFRVIDGTF